MGLPGWHSMRKDELVRALVNHAKPKAERIGANGHRRRPSCDARYQRRPVGESQSRRKDAGTAAAAARAIWRKTGNFGRRTSDDANRHGSGPAGRDGPRPVLAARLLGARAAKRRAGPIGARASIGTARRPVLRVFRVAGDGTAELHREIPIHGGVNHWYVDVQNPPQQYRMEIGYLTAAGQFYCLARSNTVTTPPAGTSDSVDENWADIDQNADRIFAMSGGYSHRGTSLELQELLEERLRRPMGSPMQTRYGSGASRVLAETQELPFAVDAELIVYGVSHPHAHVTLQGEPVPLRPDGSFTVRMSLPDRRQVIPVIASSPDGVEQRTIILAVERNTKVLGRVVRDPGA